MSAVFICQQCGSNSYRDLSTKRIQCSYCGTAYYKFSDDPAVVIGKSAQITVGKTVNIEIKGDLEIQEGASLDIRGQVAIEDGESPEE